MEVAICVLDNFNDNSSTSTSYKLTSSHNVHERFM